MGACTVSKARAFLLWLLAMVCFAVVAVVFFPLYALRRDIVGFRRVLGEAIADLSINLLHGVW